MEHPPRIPRVRLGTLAYILDYRCARTAQALKEVAEDMRAFQALFLQRATAVQATLDGLSALRRSSPEIYKLLRGHMNQAQVSEFISWDSHRC